MAPDEGAVPQTPWERHPTDWPSPGQGRFFALDWLSATPQPAGAHPLIENSQRCGICAAVSARRHYVFVASANVQA